MNHTEIPGTDPAGAQRLIDEGYQLLDVRTQEEWDEAHVDGATHIPLDQLVERADEVGDRVVAMCKGGGRSARATAYLRSAGRDVINLEGGITGWVEQGRPVVGAG
ncbi:rhodanese-like domain-containing protein [Naumannella cuiyingiana]|uniref:Rhodanese-related sulfurtransferase n=1 Tax=Naumannella cuiyingiana TaxID=1347891 RepID=A0A7Z0D9L3_9ACTN|nr:rhodanese-like domain-containing protein [Naumannella cuiyingiana]NYI71280.1 rhodanese-related sulfurtransferase [Naumannella cuiyingiana]